MGECCSCPDCRFDRVGDTNCSAYESMVELGEAVLERDQRILELERRLKYLLDNSMIRIGDGETAEWFDEDGKVI